MKIAMVFDGLGTGGIERVGADYAFLLQQMGHNIDIYNLKPEYSKMEEKYVGVDHIYHKKMPMWMLPDQYILMVKRWWWGKYLYPLCYLFSKCCMMLYRLTMGKRKKYDLAIAFAGHFSDLNFVSANFIKADKKLCWLHGSLMEYLVTACTYGDQYRKIKNLCVLSEANQNSALSMNRYLQGLNIAHIYNPINIQNNQYNAEHVNQLHAEYGEFLLMVSRFETDKDQQSVIRAYKLLKNRGQCQDKLVLAGDGSTKEACMQLCEELGLKEDVIFVGNRTDVEDFYTAAKIFIHSSPAEGLPTVLLEAMKYGTPIVATRSMPGVEEILKGDTYGLQCEVGNPEDIADKIARMIEDESLRGNYIRQGELRVRDFSYEKITQKLQHIMQNLS